MHPDLDVVRCILKQQIEASLAVGCDTRERELNGEQKIRLDYAGRVLLELFQNSVDRAERHVRVLAVRL